MNASERTIDAVYQKTAAQISRFLKKFAMLTTLSVIIEKFIILCSLIFLFSKSSICLFSFPFYRIEKYLFLTEKSHFEIYRVYFDLESLECPPETPVTCNTGNKFAM